MKYLDWCLKANDDSKINYECVISDKIYKFNSEDLVSNWIMHWLHNKAIISSIKKINGEWYVKLYE